MCHAIAARAQHEWNSGGAGERAKRERRGVEIAATSLRNRAHSRCDRGNHTKRPRRALSAKAEGNSEAAARRKRGETLLLRCGNLQLHILHVLQCARLLASCWPRNRSSNSLPVIYLSNDRFFVSALFLCWDCTRKGRYEARELQVAGALCRARSLLCRRPHSPLPHHCPVSLPLQHSPSPPSSSSSSS